MLAFVNLRQRAWRASSLFDALAFGGGIRQ
jgi:hypothetical protein